MNGGMYHSEWRHLSPTFRKKNMFGVILPHVFQNKSMFAEGHEKQVDSPEK